jgi:hypothetical protein
MAPLTEKDREVILSSSLNAERLARVKRELDCQASDHLLQHDGYERRIFEAGRQYARLEAEQLRADCAAIKASVGK